MAIQITFLSVVLRKSSLNRLEQQTRELASEFFLWAPEWYRQDDDLLATTFMCPADVRRFGTTLEEKTGLSRGSDWAVVDEAVGPLANAHWLEFQGGIGKVPAAWLDGTEPGRFVPTPSSEAGTLNNLPITGRFTKLFGRDSNHDADGHRDDFGRFLPDWGGRDLWLAEVEAGVDAQGNHFPGGHISVEAHPRRFEIIGQETNQSVSQGTPSNK